MRYGKVPCKAGRCGFRAALHQFSPCCLGHQLADSEVKRCCVRLWRCTDIRCSVAQQPPDLNPQVWSIAQAYSLCLPDAARPAGCCSQGSHGRTGAAGPPSQPAASSCTLRTSGGSPWRRPSAAAPWGPSDSRTAVRGSSWWAPPGTHWPRRSAAAAAGLPAPSCWLQAPGPGWSCTAEPRTGPALLPAPPRLHCPCPVGGRQGVEMLLGSGGLVSSAWEDCSAPEVLVVRAHHISCQTAGDARFDVL